MIIEVIGTIGLAIEAIVYLIVGVIGVVSPNIGVIRFIAIRFTCDLLLLLSIYSIRPESNFPPALMYSLDRKSVV